MANISKMKYLFVTVFICISINLFSEDFSGTYIIDYESLWNFELLTLKKVGSTYISLYDVPTSSGRKSYSAYEIGIWDGEQIVFDNGFSIYALKPQPDGTLHYYAIKDNNEFPGKDFRPMTEDDIEKILDLK